MPDLVFFIRFQTYLREVYICTFKRCSCVGINQKCAKIFLQSEDLKIDRKDEVCEVVETEGLCNPALLVNLSAAQTSFL